MGSERAAAALFEKDVAAMLTTLRALPTNPLRIMAASRPSCAP